MRSQAAPLALLLLLAGCTGGGDGGTDPTTGPTETPGLAPQQILSEEGNPRCDSVLVGNVSFEFDVHEGYDTLEVTFHKSGVGQVGFEIRSSNGSVIAGLPDENPANQPCSHAHTAAPQEHAAEPGSYTATVRNQGILGWHLIVNEKRAGNGSLPHDHDG